MENQAGADRCERTHGDVHLRVLYDSKLGSARDSNVLPVDLFRFDWIL